MALTTCPECTGQISDKAYICPHCGLPLQNIALPPKAPRKARKRRPNGSGTVVKLSGKRRKPFQVRVNTRIDAYGFPVYDVLDNFPDRVSAEIALAEYNKDPYNPNDRRRTFSEVFSSWYLWKFKQPHTTKGKSSYEYCIVSAYKKCEPLYSMPMWEIKAADMQDILDADNLTHSMTEHIRNLLRQMYRYSMQFELVQKDYSQYLRITKKDDDKHGVPFTADELKLLWQHKDLPFVDTVLIYCYSGWRINELANMPLADIDLAAGTFQGGLKTRFSKNRIVPIHSDILPLVQHRRDEQFGSLIYHDGSQQITEQKYREHFSAALRSCGIHTEHTPHDCRHTFNTLLDQAGVDRITRYKLMGHAGKDINESVYTHKNIDQLRAAVEMIKIEP